MTRRSAARARPRWCEEMARSIPTPSAVIVGEPTRHARGHRPQGLGVLRSRTVRGHSVHSSRIDQGVSAVMVARSAGRLARRRAGGEPAAGPTPTNPLRAALHDAALRHDPGRHGRQHRGRRVRASSRRSGPSRAKIPRTTWRASRPMSATSIEPAMKAIAPETGVDMVLPRRGAGTGARKRTGGRAPRAPAHRRQRDAGRLLRHGGRHFPERRLVDRGLRARRHRAGASGRTNISRSREFEAGEAFMRRLVADSAPEARIRRVFGAGPGPRNRV